MKRGSAMMINVLCFIFITSIGVIINATNVQEIAKHFDISEEEMEECMHKTGFDESELEAAASDETSENLKRLDCLFACIAVKSELMENSKLVPDKWIYYILPDRTVTQDKQRETIYSCAAQANKESDECEILGIFLDCISSML